MTTHERLMDARLRIAQGERLARLVLKDILRPYGVKGLEVCCDEEYRKEDYNPMTEINPNDHQYIERIRYNQDFDELEMFVQGRWMWLVDTDLHFLLDVVERIVYYE